MIIGTAGHIDHGKTALVRALTGVDTDRLPEEKQRGITIELGYAFLPAASGGVLGFIDVPGHEKFVHTMLAGATGIDFGLIVVAADDGVMPQTREHIDILTLLGIRDGAVAITKTDRVDQARCAEVAAEVRTLLANTLLVGVPLFEVSSITGAGIDALRAQLLAVQAVHQRIDGGERFRLAVDRVFTLEGHGTIVTGTVFSGRVQVGDHVALSPKFGTGQAVTIRVRSIHAQNRRAEQGRAGDRCALNLAGIGKDEIARGQWITATDVALESARIDVSVHVLSGESAALRGNTQVHVHIGAAHALGRLVPLEDDAISPGAGGIAQLVLHHPVGAWRGDRFILRDASAQRTLAGGRVIDPFAPPRYRKTRERLAALVAHSTDDPAQSLDALTRTSAWGVDLAQFARARCLSLDSLRRLPSACRKVVDGNNEFAFDPVRFDELQATLLGALDAQHLQHPDLAGLDVARLKRIAMPKLPEAAMNALVSTAMLAGECVRIGVWLARPSHAEKLNQQDQLIAERALPLIVDGRFDPPWIRDIAHSIGQPEALTRAVLARLARQGNLFAIVKDLYYGLAAIDELSRIALRLDESEHTVRAAAFRDATGLGRKRAIQVLEFFDKVGFTRRLGDDHKVRNRDLFKTSAGSACHELRRA